MELIVAAFIFYFVIKYAVRNAIIEAKVKELDLSFELRVNDLLEKITSIGNEIIINTKSKKFRDRAKEINDNSLKISISDKTDEEKFSLLKHEENEIMTLKNESSSFL
ncbi:hypothetical protein [Salinicoccus sp. HZC-1]|uniref:hypothetical protein n=1 Tax=Salinicoccus sp. HZC-1 TaxID=3385497 RepID=UPI00398B5277